MGPGPVRPRARGRCANAIFFRTTINLVHAVYIYVYTWGCKCVLIYHSCTGPTLIYTNLNSLDISPTLVGTDATLIDTTPTLICN